MSSASLSITAQPPSINTITTTTTTTNNPTIANLIQSILTFNPSPTLLNNNAVFRISQNYPTLKKNKKIIRRIVEYYFIKIREYYLGSEMKKLLKFMVVDDKDNVTYVKSMDEYKNNTEGIKDLVKNKYFSKKILTKEYIKNILNKFRKKHRTEWYKLGETKVEKKAIKYLFDKTMKKLKNKIE